MGTNINGNTLIKLMQAHVFASSHLNFTVKATATMIISKNTSDAMQTASRGEILKFYYPPISRQFKNVLILLSTRDTYMLVFKKATIAGLVTNLLESMAFQTNANID